MRRLLAIVATLFLLAMPVLALTPDELLKDPALESRARGLSAQLRCLVCQNQSIDDSDAPLAKDLRQLIRERLVKGETDEQVMDYIVGRYGDFVLLKPRLTSHTLLLWATPFVALVLGGILLWRRRPSAVPVSIETSAERPLDSAEKAELEKALK